MSTMLVMRGRGTSYCPEFKLNSVKFFVDNAGSVEKMVYLPSNNGAIVDFYTFDGYVCWFEFSSLKEALEFVNQNCFNHVIKACVYR